MPRMSEFLPGLPGYAARDAVTSAHARRGAEMRLRTTLLQHCLGRRAQRLSQGLLRLPGELCGALPIACLQRTPGQRRRIIAN